MPVILNLFRIDAICALDEFFAVLAYEVQNKQEHDVHNKERPRNRKIKYLYPSLTTIAEGGVFKLRLVTQKIFIVGFTRIVDP